MPPQNTYSNNPLLTQQRRKQRTQAGMPGQGGRPPFAPPPPMFTGTPGTQPPSVQPPPPPILRPPGTLPPPPGAQPPPIAQPPAPAPAPFVGTWAPPSPASGYQQYWQEGIGIFGQPTGDPNALVNQQLRAFAQMRGMEDAYRRMQAGEFEELRRAFQTNLALTMGPREEQNRRALEQELGRRGLSYSGLEQSAMAQFQAMVGTETARSLAEFEGKLLQIQQAERARMREGHMDLILNMHRASYDTTLQKDLFAFQANLQRDLQKDMMWQNILSSAGQIGMLFGGDVWGWAQNQYRGAKTAQAWSQVPDLGWIP